MRDVVADTGNLMNKSFNLTQHPVDADRQLVERVIAPARGQPLPQVAGNDSLDPSVDLSEPVVSTPAQDHSDKHRQTESWQEAQRVADELLQKYLVGRVEFLEVEARQRPGKALAAGAKEIKLIMETMDHQLENIEQAVRPLPAKGLAALEQTA